MWLWCLSVAAYLSIFVILKQVLDASVTPESRALPPSILTEMMAHDLEVIRQIREYFFASIEDIIELVECGNWANMSAQLEVFLSDVDFHYEAFRRAKVNDLAHDLRNILHAIEMSFELFDMIPDRDSLLNRLQTQVFFLKLLSGKRGGEPLRLFHVLNALGDMAQVHPPEINVSIAHTAEPKELARALYNLIQNALSNGAKNVGVWVVSGGEFPLQKFVGGFVNHVEFAQWQSSSGWGILVQDNGPGVAEGRNLVEEGIAKNGRSIHGNGVRIAVDSASRCGTQLWQLNSGPQLEARLQGLAWLMAFPGQAQAEPEGKEQEREEQAVHKN